MPVHRERSTPPSHSATSANRTMPKALGKGSLAQARSTTCQRLLRELQIHMVRTQTQGRLAATSQRLPVWCKLPTSINTGRSATPATSLTRPPLDRHKKGLRGRGKEGRPTTQHLALGSLMVSTGPFHLPIPVSHPDKAPTRLLSNLSFSPRPPQRRNCYLQRDLGKKNRRLKILPVWKLAGRFQRLPTTHSLSNLSFIPWQLEGPHGSGHGAPCHPSTR